jgi:hypothetical protein
MVKVVVNDSQGLVQKPGSGSDFNSSLKLGNVAYTAGSTIRAAASAAQLGSELVQLIDSTDDGHFVKMPLAAGAGQIIIVCNVDSGQEAIIRNNADSGNLATAVEGTSVLLVSSAAGDNWTAHLSL